MAKELPYFKFNAAQWISGAITLEDLTTQGAFVNICAYYWFNSGCLKLSEIKRRVKLKDSTIDKLITGNHIKLDGDMIEISFLREQFDERGHISKRNSENGSKGGAPKGNKNAEKNNREQPKTTNIEREENKKEKREEIEGERDTLPLLGIDVSLEKLLKDEIWVGNIQPLAKGKDLPGAARAAFLFLESKPHRFKTATIAELKQTTLSWLENQKHGVNGQHKEKAEDRFNRLRK